MDIHVPSVFTQFHSSEVDLHTPVMEETLLKMSANNNMLLNLMPVGSVIYINTQQSGGTTPDPSMWQYCDGAEITNPASPLRSLGIFTGNVPDLRDKYPRASLNDTNDNFVGGSTNRNWSHGHTIYGSGGGQGPTIEEDKDGPADQPHVPFHSHGISSDLPNGQILSPKFFLVNAYMKVV